MNAVRLRTESEVRKVENAREVMIHQLKEQFGSTTNRSGIMKSLTVLPQSWSTHKFAESFGVLPALGEKGQTIGSREEYPI